MMVRTASLALLLAFLSVAAPSLAAQVRSSPPPAAQPAPAVPVPPPAAAPGTAAGASVAPAGDAAPGLSRGFRGVELGMSRDEVIAALKADSLYAYRGPEDVSLLAAPNQSLIEVQGLSFVKRAFFQFYEGKLWVMILSLDTARMDHYSVYVSLVAKYGEPGLIDPREARWEDGSSRVALERPLTLRWLDLGVLTLLREGSAARESVEELERRDFLGGL